jgi:hypothetical protein
MTAETGRAVPPVVLPTPRGSLSDMLLGALIDGDTRRLASEPEPLADPLGDDDLHLALYLCYELHYRGLPDVDPAMEWNPDVLRFRAGLEGPFERALRAAVPTEPVVPSSVPAALRAMAREGDGVLSRHLERRADLARFLEFLIHRSIYHLKEADPHSFAIPRLAGKPKAALVEIQADEYGGGDAAWMHSTLFARTLAAVGLDATYGAYLDRAPGWTLATVNLMSLFGLHRRLRGAAVGHLAMFEMTSTLPNRRYGNGLRRLGFGREATLFFDEHVEADAVHEAIAADNLAGSLVVDEPDLAADVILGAQALTLLEARAAEETMRAWEAGRTSLRGSAVERSMDASKGASHAA